MAALSIAHTAACEMVPVAFATASSLTSCSKSVYFMLWLKQTDKNIIEQWARKVSHWIGTSI